MTVAPEQIAPPEELLRCPLCDYDLRATTEPRCPECGYGFTWEELRDPARCIHPYAFEHHPERNVLSFVQTVLAGLFPRRFWRTLHPTQPSRPKRLLLYWMIVSLTCVTPLAVQIVRAWPVVETELVKQRNIATRAMAQYPDEFAGAALRLYPTTQAYLDTRFPIPTRRNVAESLVRYDYTTRTFGLATAFYVIWPWLTFVCLMIFQFSMRRARIKPGHVIRCVVYTGDIAVWVTLATLAIVAQQAARTGWVGTGLWNGSSIDRVVLLVIAASFPVFAWRLSAAYRHYLRFPHARATALSVQFMILLLLAYLATEWDVLRF